MINIVKKLLNHNKQPASDVIKTASKRAIKKTPAAIGDFICTKIVEIITNNSIKWKLSWKFIRNTRTIHIARKKITNYWQIY